MADFSRADGDCSRSGTVVALSVLPEHLRTDDNTSLSLSDAVADVDSDDSLSLFFRIPV